MLQGQHEDGAEGGYGVEDGGINIWVNDFHGFLRVGESMMKGALAQGVSLRILGTFNCNSGIADRLWRQWTRASLCSMSPENCWKISGSILVPHSDSRMLMT